MNVPKALWLWVKSFLTAGRTQQVKLQGVMTRCPAGAPQGSALSLTLFNIHTDDLDDPENHRINAHKYADDCTLDEVVEYGSLSHMQETQYLNMHRQFGVEFHSTSKKN